MAGGRPSFGLGKEMAEGWPGPSKLISTAPGQRRLFLFQGFILVAAQKARRRMGAAPPGKKLEIVQKFNLAHATQEPVVDDPDGLVFRFKCPSTQGSQEIFSFKMSNSVARASLDNAVKQKGVHFNFALL
ncbi:hypothetical protein HDU76_000393 [Blyttiomyces sp. JEL0837]|nr:hypothetical protein HDU76_000393 [Blyttiomyces sp. JEL0837]